MRGGWFSSAVDPPLPNGRGSLPSFYLMGLQIGQHFVGAVQDFFGHAGQLSYVNAVTLVGAAGSDLMQEDNLSFALLHQDIVVSQAGKFVGQLSQFVIVRGEKHAATDLVVQILGNGPSQTHAVVGAGAAADLIEDHQAAVGGVVEDVGGFGHLDHKGAAA